MVAKVAAGKLPAMHTHASHGPYICLVAEVAAGKHVTYALWHLLTLYAWLLKLLLRHSMFPSFAPYACPRCFVAKVAVLQYMRSYGQLLPHPMCLVAKVAERKLIGFIFCYFQKSKVVSLHI